MCLGVKHKLVQRNKVRVVRKKQIEVFQRLAEPEALHFVPILRTARRLNVSDRRISDREFGVFLECLEYFPAPVLVGLISG